MNMNIFKRASAVKNVSDGKPGGKKGANNDGMTLVEVLVGSAILAILTGMICVVANASLRQQTETAYWNEQTDMQASYLSNHRYDATVDVDGNSTGIEFTGGGTNYELKLNTGTDEVSLGSNVSIYSVDTQYEKDSDGDNLPTYEDANIYFFRVD